MPIRTDARPTRQARFIGRLQQPRRRTAATPTTTIASATSQGDPAAGLGRARHLGADRQVAHALRHRRAAGSRVVDSAGFGLRTTWSTAMKLVYCVSRLYCRPSAVIASRLRVAAFERLLVAQSCAMRWRAQRWRSAAVHLSSRRSARASPAARRPRRRGLRPPAVAARLAAPLADQTTTGRPPSTSGRLAPARRRRRRGRRSAPSPASAPARRSSCAAARPAPRPTRAW